ncbi:AmmeMemoRadiSam system protein B [Candidatus Woesebacteria bacterium]|nr:AmmeMemoRadiSam system protein B [Candidatus Woesebacteria bacterium]
MRFIKYFLLGLIVLVVIFLVFPKTVKEEANLHNSNFFERESFFKGAEIVENNHITYDKKISGGIIPHHLLAGFIISDFFKRLTFNPPKTIILIGPNHYEKGNFKSLTSLYGWNTPFGIVSSDREKISKLVDVNLLKIDEETLPGDHSVVGIMPYIKFYLPNTKVVLILLSGLMTENDVKLLSDSLKTVSDENTTIIASVDFSHYLRGVEAQEKDKKTLELIKNYNYPGLFSLNNDYLDSASSVSVLLMTMQSLNKMNMEVLQNTNSGVIENDNTRQSTSYFSIVYY